MKIFCKKLITKILFLLRGKKIFKNTKFLYIELLLLLCVVATFSIVLFTSLIHINETYSILEKQCNVINKTLINLFDSVTGIMIDMGEKFEQEKPSSKKEIEKFLLKYSNPIMIKTEDKDHELHNIFTYPSFGWIGDRSVVVPNQSSFSLNYDYHPEYKKLIEQSKKSHVLFIFLPLKSDLQVVYGEFLQV